MYIIGLSLNLCHYLWFYRKGYKRASHKNKSPNRFTSERNKSVSSLITLAVGVKHATNHKLYKKTTDLHLFVIDLICGYSFLYKLQFCFVLEIPLLCHPQIVIKDSLIIIYTKCHCKSAVCSYFYSSFVKTSVSFNLNVKVWISLGFETKIAVDYAFIPLDKTGR